MFIFIIITSKKVLFIENYIYWSIKISWVWNTVILKTMLVYTVFTNFVFYGTGRWNQL